MGRALGADGAAAFFVHHHKGGWVALENVFCARPLPPVHGLLSLPIRHSTFGEGCEGGQCCTERPQEGRCLGLGSPAWQGCQRLTNERFQRPALTSPCCCRTRLLPSSGPIDPLPLLKMMQGAAANTTEIPAS